ncbi:MAG: ABC-F family ATP-binding cassette domain-containing protein [Firmicutes bacterium]|nr:ABC-F family ATP-binding cassette domain-containing protein [Bacillota bacterium]
MSWLAAYDVTLAYGARTLVERMTFTLDPGDRLAVVGPNGMGKSTLIAALTHQRDPDHGVIKMAAEIKLAHLAQWDAPTLQETVWDAAWAANPGLHAAELRLKQLEKEMADPQVAADADRLQQVLDEWGELSEQFRAQGGYEWDARCKEALQRTGFDPARFDQKVLSLSGGEHHRLHLVQVILSGADIWLLDEPTNHLDVATIAWLEEQIRQFRGAVLVISHDRAFLDHIAQAVMTWEDGFFWVVNGNYSRYQHLRAERKQQEAQKRQRLSEEEERLKDYIARYRSGSRAKQAQSRVKRLVRIVEAKESTTGVVKPVTTPGTLIQKGIKRLRVEPAVVVDQLHIQHGQRQWEPLSLSIPAGARVAIIGANGAGKSSLMHALMEGAPGVAWAPDSWRVWLDQQAVQQLPEEQTGMEYAYALGFDKEAIFFVGAHFGIAPALWETALAGWSGGERMRLKLLEALMTPSDVLMMDEPSNHLDIAMTESLEAILQEYPGTILMVSHDRALLEHLSTHTLWATGSGFIWDPAPFRMDRAAPRAR